MPASSGTGRHVDPSRSASVRTCAIAARRRPTESEGTPAARAIVSAMWKPTPNTFVSSYGRVRTTSCWSPYSAAIFGTSHASPCGASSRCSERVERSAFHDRIASLTRLGVKPSDRNAAAGS